MIPKSMPSGDDPTGGYRFSDQIMRKTRSMIPKSGYRFSDQIMRKTKV
jgi:hypothetical protein